MNTSIRGRHVGARLALCLATATVALLLAGSAAAAELDRSAVRDGWSASAGTRLAGTSAVSSLGSALAPAPAGSGREPYVPFSTDFPKRASAQQFVPFVTDFGKEPRVPGRTVVVGPLRQVATPAPVAEPVGGRSWADVALGATMGLALATVLGLGLVGARRLRGRDGAGLPDAPAGAAR